ncbi:hypothetical protein PMAYCL1PPCAC_25534, partial [Pristionchus mayeri]
NSNFVLQWVINNARATHAAGKAESDEFNKGGFKWTAALDMLNSNADLTLRCCLDHKGPWKCEAEVDVFFHTLSGRHHYIVKHRLDFDRENNSIALPKSFNWDVLTHQHFNINGTFTVDFELRILNSERCEINLPSFLDAPNRMSNVILKIGNNKLHVSKEYLAVQSPVFETLFFGDFAE